MKSEIIESRVKSAIDDAELEVTGADCDFTVTIISEQFQGLPRVKRQQRILSAFSDLLASGELHALTVKAYTLNEWNQRSNTYIQISL